MWATFLQKSRHGSVYYFRRKVPLDLRDCIGRMQIYKTLRTADRKEAMIAARLLAARTDQIFQQLRLMPDKKKETLRVNFNLEVDFDELGAPRRANFSDVKADEAQAVNEVLKNLSTARSAAPQSQHDGVTTMTVKEAVTKMLARPELKPRTVTRYTSILNDFMEFIGSDTQIHTVSHERFTEYADRVNSTDKSASTKGDYITVVGRLFNWAHVRDRRIPEMSTKDLKPSREQPAYMDRAAFSMEELGALMQHVAKYRVDEPHRFWATVVPMFLGCRIEELAQLDLHKDIKHDAEADLWYLDMCETEVKARDGGKSLKKLGSWRKVPVHPKLVHEGFIGYLHAERDAGAKSPFDRHWKPYADKHGGVIRAHAIVKWGGRVRDQLVAKGIITTPKVTYFHSARHSLITHLAIRNVPVEVRAAMCGQTDSGGGVNGEVYTKLKANPVALSHIVHPHMDEYVALFDAALAVVPFTRHPNEQDNNQHQMD